MKFSKYSLRVDPEVTFCKRLRARCVQIRGGIRSKRVNIMKRFNMEYMLCVFQLNNNEIHVICHEYAHYLLAPLKVPLYCTWFKVQGLGFRGHPTPYPFAKLLVSAL